MTEPTHAPTPSPEDTESETHVDDRRRGERVEAQLAITVKVDTAQFEGRTQNVSRAGVFFFSEDQLQVTVALEQEGETVTRRGHLVRVERMNEDTTGFAIEFDE